MAAPMYKVKISVKEYSTHRCNLKTTLKALINEIHTRMPYLKLEYAYVNSGDPLERIEMMLLFSFIAKNGESTIKKYFVYIANTFSYYSLEGFDICRQRGKLDEWFEDFKEKPVVYPEIFLKDIINDSDDKLTWYKDPNAPEKYWKDPNNGKAVAEQLDKYATSYHTRAPKR